MGSLWESILLKQLAAVFHKEKVPAVTEKVGRASSFQNY